MLRVTNEPHNFYAALWRKYEEAAWRRVVSTVMRGFTNDSGKAQAPMPRGYQSSSVIDFPFTAGLPTPDAGVQLAMRCNCLVRLSFAPSSSPHLVPVGDTPSLYYLLMAWTAYLAIFSLSFAVSALTARSNTVATQTRWTTATPLIPFLSPTPFVVSALALILAALFGTVHTILYWNAKTSGHDALTHRVRRAVGRAFKAVLYERACRILRVVVGVSSIPRRDLLESRSVMEVFDYRVWGRVYYLLVSEVQAGVVVLFHKFNRRAYVVSEVRLGIISDWSCANDLVARRRSSTVFLRS